MKIKTMFVSLALLAFSLTACGTSGKETVSNHRGDALAYGVGGAAEQTVRRTLKLKNFHGVAASSNVEIHYTQGDKYEVVAEAMPSVFDDNIITVSDGMLTVRLKDGAARKGGRSKGGTIVINDGGQKMFFNGIGSVAGAWNAGLVTLYVTAPSLDVLENKYSMSFYADVVKADKFSASNKGSLDIHVTAVKAASVNITNYGSTEVDGDIDAASVTYRNNGSISFSSDFTVDDALTGRNNGSLSLQGKITARTVNLVNRGSSDADMDVKSNTLSLQNSGSSTGHITFSGDRAEVNCSGYAGLRLTVDCTYLDVGASGSVDIEVDGTAEHTEFRSSGVAEIKTEGLNKF